MNYFVRRPWDLPDRLLTPEPLVLHRQGRREFLASLGLPMGLCLTAPWLSGCHPAPEEKILSTIVETGQGHYPARRADAFDYGRPETHRRDAAEFTNFYEFTSRKTVYEYVAGFQPSPWSFEVAGLCRNPRRFDLDDIYRLFPLEERAYRHRCVETWAMCVPWTGFPLSELLKLVDPLPAARFVRFETFFRPGEAPRQEYSEYPWPYTEGLTIAEALHPLTLLATGIFGQPLLKQHGAPIRLVVPWKYGFKSIKSIVRIELTAEQPATFWNTLNPHEYGFEANVDPDVPHPRWSQEMEWMLGTRERYRTQKYNGYGEYVAALYP